MKAFVLLGIVLVVLGTVALIYDGITYTTRHGASPSRLKRLNLIVIGAIVEQDRLGGECPNYACHPSETLLRSAKL